MRVLPTTTGLALELEYLRALYELAGGKAKSSVFYGDISRELDWPPDKADEVAYFWADRGMLEWTTFGNVALTHMGLRKAERLANNGWSLASL
jgi:Mn-dependent DtxR family transcriptional regulator